MLLNGGLARAVVVLGWSRRVSYNANLVVFIDHEETLFFDVGAYASVYLDLNLGRLLWLFVVEVV